MENKTTYIVQEVTDENYDTKTIKLRLEDGTVPHYEAGQFITVYFPECQLHEGKAYTFSSTPTESTCNITVKNIGEFSGKLCALQSGEKISASLPYGFFSTEYPDHELILLAGGIGITPFRSIILDTLAKYPTREIKVFYSTKSITDIVFKEEFTRLISQYPNLTFTHYITQDIPESEDVRKGRIDPSQLVVELGDTKQKEFLLCGSISFVRDLWKGLKSNGVDENLIYTEAFFR